MAHGQTRHWVANRRRLVSVPGGCGQLTAVGGRLAVFVACIAWPSAKRVAWFSRHHT